MTRDAKTTKTVMQTEHNQSGSCVGGSGAFYRPVSRGPVSYSVSMVV